MFRLLRALARGGDRVFELGVRRSRFWAQSLDLKGLAQGCRCSQPGQGRDFVVLGCMLFLPQVSVHSLVVCTSHLHGTTARQHPRKQREAKMSI